MSRFALLPALALSLASAVALAQPPAFNVQALEQATGMKGTYNAREHVYKVTKARKEMTAIDDWKVPPFLGTSSYAAFTPTGRGAELMVMGDNVLYEDEVGPTMNAALQNGLEVTALHNHFFFEQPRVYFMHISGIGDAARLGNAVRRVMDAPEQVRAANPTPSGSYSGPKLPAESHITAEPLARIFGKKGESNNGMFKVSFGRPVKMHGVTAGDGLGVNTWAGFAGTDEQAIVDGDFAVLEKELQPVLKSLRGAGINIVAIHQHMTMEQPRLIFLHYWGQGRAQDLAQAVHGAIVRTATKVE